MRRSAHGVVVRSRPISPVGNVRPPVVDLVEGRSGITSSTRLGLRPALRRRGPTSPPWMDCQNSRQRRASTGVAAAAGWPIQFSDDANQLEVSVVFGSTPVASHDDRLHVSLGSAGLGPSLRRSSPTLVDSCSGMIVSVKARSATFCACVRLYDQDSQRRGGGRRSAGDCIAIISGPPGPCSGRPRSPHARARRRPGRARQHGRCRPDP